MLSVSARKFTCYSRQNRWQARVGKREIIKIYMLYVCMYIHRERDTHTHRCIDR
jgi:hypothetical protein